MDKLFFSLIQVSLGLSRYLIKEPSINEWNLLYDMSIKQAIAGICFNGISYLYQPEDDDNCWNESHGTTNLPIELYYQWMATALQIQMNNEIVNGQCQEIQQRIHFDGLHSCILKGQGVAQLYRITFDDKEQSLSTYRQSGDIDIWINNSPEEVIKYVTSLAPSDSFDQKHIHCHYFDNTDVEVHWIPVSRSNPYRNRILRQYFYSEWERQSHNIQIINDDISLIVPTIDFQLVHQLLHIYSHYVYEGVGLRQLMDLYFTVKACPNARYANIESLFKRLHMEKFLKASMWVLQTVFSEDTIITCPNSIEGRKMLNEIMTGGNMGHYDSRNMVENESVMHRYYRRIINMIRKFRFDPFGILCSPIYRLSLTIWIKQIRNKYNFS